MSDKQDNLGASFLAKIISRISFLDSFNNIREDLIQYLKDSKIIFLEVKTRKNNIFAEPEDFVNPNKQKQMALAADEYIHIMNHQHEIRFDIISILFDKFGEPIIKHIQDAFWP